MCAGILGLLLSLAGLVAVWVEKPTIAAFATTTISTLNASVSTSQQAMQVTGRALGATIDSVDALSTMLGATATSLQDSQPMLDQVNNILDEKLPATMESATGSLKTAQQGAEVLESTIRSIDSFRSALSAAPLVGAYVEKPKQAYNPEKPLAESLGDLATNLEDLPAMFTEMATSLDTADDSLVTVQSSLSIMSGSVGLISKSLGEYQVMISQSESSLDDLQLMLTAIEINLTSILNGAAILFSLFFLWLLAAQVVIFSQGWELFRGTAALVEKFIADEPAPEEPAAAP